MVPGGARLGGAAAASFLLLLPLLAAPARAKDYATFKREHSNFPPTDVPERRLYCDLLMRRRLLATRRSCEPLNAFLHAPRASIARVCRGRGKSAGGNLRESFDRFPLTLCRLRQGSRPPDCRYEVADRVERIVVACAGGFPVDLKSPSRSPRGGGRAEASLLSLH